MSGHYDEDTRLRGKAAHVEGAPKDRLIAQLQIARDNLCLSNARNQKQVSNYAAEYGAGVEAMWKAAEDVLKAWVVE